MNAKPMLVSSEWEWYVDHISRWVDFKNAYKTMDLSYMESVMWVFKKMYEKGYIYKGLRVSLYCPHCATPISNFEVAMDADNYKEVVDPGTVYKYKIRGEENTYILAWSTTPWNKIVTPALAVNPELEYIKVKQGNEYYILASSTKEILKKESYTVDETFLGDKLVGKLFEPHYNYYPIEPGEKAFEIIPGDFVTAEEGTGVVTIAAYGEDDLKAMQQHKVHIEIHLDEEGTIKPDVPLFGGMYYLKANKLVNEDLHKRGLIYQDNGYAHKVPLCWRCHTRLYYTPQDAWYVDVQRLKPKLKKNNEIVNWFPKHFKYGRFLKSVEAAPDWCISRSRYFGSPVPVWECECGQRFVPGSIKELEERSGAKITDLHKPQIDEITVQCIKCCRKAKRVQEVLDSWIEAGSASFAERHFPFEKNLTLEEFFPPDFIVEYTGQIRAWFYVLHVIATALYDSNAFKNVVVTGVILGADGRKMSKNFGNYPDPKEMLREYGGDALRLYLMGSPVMHGEDILISKDQYRNQVKGLMLLLWNVYNFFVSYANTDKWKPIKNTEFKPIGVLDRFILSRLTKLIQQITEDLERYDTVSGIGHLHKFIEELSRWYVRRIRDSVGPSADVGRDKDYAYQTLWIVLFEYAKLLAPFSPFLADEVYRNLVSGSESVHLESWPKAFLGYIDEELEEDMNHAITLSSKIHAFRKDANIKVRIPLKKLFYKGPHQLSKDIISIVQDEVNVYKLEYGGEDDHYAISGETGQVNQDLSMGQAREVVRKIQQERKKLGTKLDEHVHVQLESWPEEHEEFIKKHALTGKIIKGEFMVRRV